MAEKEEEFPLGTPQEPALMCEKHALMPIDVKCEDCEEDVKKITVTETDSFQWRDKQIAVLKAMNEGTCLIADDESPYIEQVSKSGKIEKRFSVNINDVCVIHNNEVYITDIYNKSISRLSPSGSVSPVFGTDPQEPWGICQTMDSDLLVTLTDAETDDLYQLNSDSRRLVRHVTLTGDVIREYEYQEDGQTRLFTLPVRVTQNGNTDICVINWTSDTTGELIILSFSGCLKSVYPEQGQRDHVLLTDVVCDSHYNIIVGEVFSSTIQLLSPKGMFLTNLVTKNENNYPTAISLKNSTLWIGDFNGCIKVYQYKS